MTAGHVPTLSHPVVTAADVVSLGANERRMLARWLAEQEIVPEQAKTVGQPNYQ